MAVKKPNSAVDLQAIVDSLCEQLRQAFQQGLPSSIESLLNEVPDSLRDLALEELIAEEAQLRAAWRPPNMGRICETVW